ncbi:MAG TPA: hypothetical protein DEF47_13045 [Herpetosiphon sp.]|nr:hypothetical protein [Herpetosiphon sp.]
MLRDVGFSVNPLHAIANLSIEYQPTAKLKEKLHNLRQRDDNKIKRQKSKGKKNQAYNEDNCGNQQCFSTG